MVYRCPDIQLVLNLEARSPALIWGREELIQYMRREAARGGS
jgi:hypothetical protein